ncbi:hypothetical protein Hanom_Chr01g00057551 [Helianthus anomalus]
MDLIVACFLDRLEREICDVLGRGGVTHGCHVSRDKPKKSYGGRGLKVLFKKNKSKLSFGSLWFGHFYHFSLNLKLFTTRSLWFAFYCHFSLKFKNPIF